MAGTTTKTVTEQSDVWTHRRAREATIAHNDPPVTALLRQAGNRATRIALGARVPVLQRKCACGGGNGSPCECDEEKARESIRIQPKLLLSEPGNAYEQEADRVAEAVMRDPLGSGVRPQAPAGPVIHRYVPHPTSSTNAISVLAAGDLGTRLQAAASGGTPLQPGIRTRIEARFGADFGDVRVHTGGAAAALSDDLNALAFTHGRDVYFARGMYEPGTPRGERLLAHELTHVVQQRGLPESGPGAKAEGNVVQRQIRMAVLCNDLLNAPEIAPSDRPSGTAAHAAVGRAFRAELGAAARGVRPIPGGHFRETATSCGDAPPGSTEDAPRPDLTAGGGGIPDLVYRRGTALEIAELKPAHPTCIPEAELQVHNYVSKGNAEYNAAWRASEGIARCELMPVGRSALEHVLVGSRVARLSWCAPGVVVYKVVRDGERDVIACVPGEPLDRALDQLLDPAQAAVNREISVGLDQAMDRVIDTITIRQAVRGLWKITKAALVARVRREQGDLAARAFAAMLDAAAAERVADWLERNISGEAQALLRSVAHGLKAQFIQRIRAHVQRELRTLLQEALVAACAAAVAGVVTLADVIRQLLAGLRRRLGEIIIEEGVAWAREMIVELEKAILEGLAIGLLAAVAAVVIIFALPEILVALGIGEALAAIGAALVALGEAIAVAFAELWPVILGLGPVIERGLAPAFR